MKEEVLPQTSDGGAPEGAVASVARGGRGGSGTSSGAGRFFAAMVGDGGGGGKKLKSSMPASTSDTWDAALEAMQPLEGEASPLIQP